MGMGRLRIVITIGVATFMVFAITGMAEAGIVGPYYSGPFGPLGGAATVFPYIIKDDPNITTIVSVMVSDPSGENTDAAELHYVYLYKDIDASDTDACEEYNFKGHTSPNDLVTFDVSGMFGDEPGREGLPLFSDTTSDPLISGSTLALTVGPSIGYLVVEALDENNEPFIEPYPITGEALILDIANGGAWGYKAWSDYWFKDEEAVLWYTVVGSSWLGAAPIGLYPTSIATTEFVITPLSLGVFYQEGYDADLLKNQSVIVKPVTITNSGNIITAQIYDRNENTLSSTTEKKVTCTGVVSLDELVSEGIRNNTAFQAQGGWGYLYNKPFDVDGDGVVENTSWLYNEQNAAWIYKVESSSELGSFMINAMENGGWL